MTKSKIQETPNKPIRRSERKKNSITTNTTHKTKKKISKQETENNICKKLTFEKFKPEEPKHHHKIKLKSQDYRLSSKILQRHGISQGQRMTLRAKISTNCFRYFLSKRTLSLAHYLVDLCFHHGLTVKEQELKWFGIACLILVDKLEDNKFAGIQKQQLHQRVYSLQSQILFKLNWKITPLTAIELAQQLVYFWKGFCEKNLDLQKEIITNFSFHLLYQFLEFCLHFLPTLDFQLDVLVFNAFYLIFCVQNSYHQPYQNPETQKTNKSTRCKMSSIMKKFSAYCLSEGYILDVKFNQKVTKYLERLFKSLISKFDGRRFPEYQRKEFNPNHRIWTMKLKVCQYFDTLDEENNLKILKVIQKDSHLVQSNFFFNKKDSFEEHVNIEMMPTRRSL